MTRRKTIVDLREYPAAMEMARTFYQESGHLRQKRECRVIGDLIGMSDLGIWHA